MRPYLIALAMSAVSLVLLLGLQHYLKQPNSTMPQYFSDLAWSFLHSRTDITTQPATSGDLSIYAGKVYAYWPPMPAVLMMPIVAFTGPYQFPQRTFCLVLSAVNVGLFSLFLHFFLRHLGQKWTPLSESAFSLIYGFGTSNSVFGFAASVWFASQLVASTFLLLTFWLCVDDHLSMSWSSWFVGFALSALFLSRNNLILAVPFVILLWAFTRDQDLFYSASLSKVIRSIRTIPLRGFIMPLLAAISLQLAYNDIRFHRIFDTGVFYQNMGDQVRMNLHRYGRFSLAYLPRNMLFTLFAFPRYGLPGDGHRAMGFSILVQCPILLLALWKRFEEPLTVFYTVLWTTIIASSLVMLLVNFTGFYQFGARYFHDVVPFLFLVLILKKQMYSDKIWWAFGFASILMNLYGVFWLAGRVSF